MQHALITNVDFKDKKLAEDGLELTFRLFRQFGKIDGKHRVKVQKANADGQIYPLVKNMTPEQLQQILHEGESLSLQVLNDADIVAETKHVTTVTPGTGQTMTLFAPKAKAAPGQQHTPALTL